MEAIRFVLLFTLFVINYRNVLCSIPGGLSEVDVNDPYIINISNTVLDKINENIDDDGKKKLSIKVISSKRQVVAGMLVYLTAEVEDGAKMVEVCDIKIWDRPWLNLQVVQSINCSGKSLLKKRNIHPKNLDLFKAFMKRNKKTYKDSAEYKTRFNIFKYNLKTINMLTLTEQGTAIYGATRFADMTEREFRQYKGLDVTLKPTTELPVADLLDLPIPDEHDWRHYNAVTPVKNQGSCGSCWAFSVTGNIEGQWAIKNPGSLLSLSEQELIDCDKIDNGCQGGYMTNAYTSIENLGGLETEKDYPYLSDNEKCHIDSSKVRVTISSAVNITKDEQQMAQWLYQNGPISIGINANAMQFYMGGVSHPWKALCEPNALDHGVLIVGYGVTHSKITNKELPYWIIKNSWGRSWGEKGYYRLYRGTDACGVSQMASSAVL